MVGIVTWHYYTNFGSALQCYALSNTISKLGYRVQVINYRNPKYLQSNRFLACLKGVIESLLGLFPPLRFRYGQTFKHFCLKLFHSHVYILHRMK